MKRITMILAAAAIGLTATAQHAPGFSPWRVGLSYDLSIPGHLKNNNPGWSAHKRQDIREGNRLCSDPCQP